MGWWDQKLNGGQQQAPASRQPYYDPHMLPRGVGADRGRAAENYMERQQQGFRPQQQPQQREEWHPNNQDPTKMSEVLPIWHWSGNPQGGARETQLVGNCPGCGSARYFSRTNAGGVTNSRTGERAYPAPECMDCGYPTQQGVISGSSKIVGAAHVARQAEADAPSDSIGHLRRA